MGIIAMLLMWLFGGFLLFCVIYYGVRMGMDSSDTSVEIRKIRKLLEKQAKEQEDNK
ncbi:hypothetical protein [Pseudalkalibacillus sp. SCS-8]|uniref:hypothetical protein n=1 Tax=Pseudalkalibacillus nanhaiensis TaxID=3115291 RepID=UPI0032DBAB24